VLETERRVRAAENDLLNTKSDLWNARIDLFLALGGDWTPSAVREPTGGDDRRSESGEDTQRSALACVDEADASTEVPS
jgi:hypothetical protein